MKTEIVQSLTETFEGHAQQTEGGVEYWLARDIQHLLGYTKWENFLNEAVKKPDSHTRHVGCARFAARISGIWRPCPKCAAISLSFASDGVSRPLWPLY